MILSDFANYINSLQPGRPRIVKAHLPDKDPLRPTRVAAI